MIVLTIISMVIALAIPTLSRVTYQRLNSTTRTFIGLIRTVRNDAILLNNIYRLVIDLDRNAYWVEEQKEFKLLTDADETPAEKKKKKGKKDEEPPSNFNPSAKYSKKPVPLPASIVFQGVLKEKEGLRKEGLVYVHFFPNGFNEQAILYLNKEGAAEGGYSVILRPNLGKVDVEPGKVAGFQTPPPK
jgi:type II secretory pathway pseudopilin PulG